MNPEGVTELTPGCNPRELTYRPIKCIDTPKPAGEEHKVRRGVLHPNISWLCVLPYGYSPFSFLFSPLAAQRASRLPASGCQYFF